MAKRSLTDFNPLPTCHRRRAADPSKSSVSFLDLSMEILLQVFACLSHADLCAVRYLNKFTAAAGMTTMMDRLSRITSISCKSAEIGRVVSVEHLCAILKRIEASWPHWTYAGIEEIVLADGLLAQWKESCPVFSALRSLKFVGLYSDDTSPLIALIWGNRKTLRHVEVRAHCLTVGGEAADDFQVGIGHCAAYKPLFIHTCKMLLLGNLKLETLILSGLCVMSRSMRDRIDSGSRDRDCRRAVESHADALDDAPWLKLENSEAAGNGYEAHLGTIKRSFPDMDDLHVFGGDAIACMLRYLASGASLMDMHFGIPAGMAPTLVMPYYTDEGLHTGGGLP